MYDYSPKRKKADESKCATQVKRIHPAPIIAIWIALSSAVIREARLGRRIGRQGAWQRREEDEDSDSGSYRLTAAVWF
jgi:hypothetical protein